MVDILALVLHHDEQAVLTAVELSLSEGVPTKTHVLNLLHRVVDGKVINGPPLDTPQALALRSEPNANVEHNDGFRTQIAGGHHASLPRRRCHRHHAAQPQNVWHGVVLKAHLRRDPSPI